MGPILSAQVQGNASVWERSFPERTDLSLPPGERRRRPEGTLTAGSASRVGQRRARGATSRLADQLRPALTVDVWERPAVGAASPISLGSTWPSRPVFGVSSTT